MSVGARAGLRGGGGWTKKNKPRMLHTSKQGRERATRPQVVMGHSRGETARRGLPHTTHTHMIPTRHPFASICFATHIRRWEMRDLHALHFFLGPDAVVGGVFPHLLVRVELGHVKGVAVGAQLEMHNGAGPVTHALLLLGSLSGVGGVANRGYRWVVGRVCVCVCLGEDVCV